MIFCYINDIILIENKRGAINLAELFNTLFSNEKFPIYLGAIIAVLVIAFCVVFFLGKKDQKKLEQTRKIDKIDDDTFKEITNEVPVEIASPVQEEPVVKEEQTVEIVPPVINNSPVKPETDGYVASAPSPIPVENPISQVDVTEPVHETYEEVKVPDYSELTSSIENELNSLENIKEEDSLSDLFKSRLEELDKMEEELNTSKVAESNQGTYIPLREEAIVEGIEEDLTMELPKLK